MSIFGKRNRGGGGLEVGLSRGSKAGHVGAWARIPAGGGEVFQVRFSAASDSGSRRLDPWSYTFLPAFDRSFCRSLETPREFKEFLTGLDRVERGEVVVDFVVSGGRTITQKYSVPDVLKLYRGKGLTAPDDAPLAPGYLEADAPYGGNLSFEELESRSRRRREELEEARQRREEEARKAKEEAERKAAEEAKKKAAAAAAAAGAPAAAPKPGGPTIQGGKVALFYGTSTNNTADVAAMLKEELGSSIDHMVNVASCSPQDFLVCDILILGVPTWHIGEMQDDWAAILPALKEQKYEGKKIAIFGLGDQKGYPDTYVDAMGELLEPFEKGGAKLFGLWPTDGYDFKKSKALRDGKFLGLVIDIENQNDKTPARVKAWADQLRKELGI